MKILHTADWHLRDRDIEECSACLSFLVETAEAEAVNLVVIAGDIFHSQDVKDDSASTRLAFKTVSALADIAPVAIVLGTPSHDGKAPEILRFAKGKFDIHVSSIPEQIYLEDGFFFDRPAGDREPDAVLSMIPTITKQYFQTVSGIAGADQEIGAAMSGLFLGFGAQAEYKAAHILVGHWNVNGCRLANGQIRTGMDIEVSVDQMNLSQCDIGLLGHIHASQVLGGKYYYSGPIYSTKIDEVGPMGFWVHLINEWDEQQPSGSRFIETPCRRTVRVVADLTPDLTETEKSDLYYHGHEDNIDGASVRIDLTVWQDETGSYDKKLIEEHYLSLGALSVDVRITPIPRVTVRAAAVLEAGRLRAKVAKRAELNGDILDAETLDMCDSLEDMTGEEILKGVTA